jgi:16S rRNA (adenine1518-N6/adenine1519-N6)-dimethyltransferase
LVGSGDRVVEVGAGLGSLTLALAESGADVVAVELDPVLVSVVEEVVRAAGNVRVVAADALRADWGDLLSDPGPWAMVANLPYNVAVRVVMRALEEEPRIERFLVMVQREVGERLAAGPGDPEYGAVSVRVAYFAEAKVIRRVPPTVFWPRPSVESVLVSLVRRPPPVQAEREALWTVIRESFAQRRKTMRNAVIRLGVPAGDAALVLEEAEIPPSARAEELRLDAFARLAGLLHAGLGGKPD